MLVSCWKGRSFASRRCRLFFTSIYFFLSGPTIFLSDRLHQISVWLQKDILLNKSSLPKILFQSTCKHFHLRKVRGPIPPTVANRNAEPESEPEPEPVAFDRNRSLRNVLLGTGASVVKNGCLRLRKERPDHALKKKILDIFFYRSRSRGRPKCSRLRVPGGEAWLNEPHLHIYKGYPK